MMVESGIVDLQYGPERLPKAPEPSLGMWRWRGLLPFDGSTEYPLHVGDTPLIRASVLENAVAGGELFLKDETRGPSGSNKDRATALCVVDAKRLSAPVVACASTGNVAVSLAVGAAAMSLTCVVFVSNASVAPQKERLMRAYGATVVKVQGTYEDAYRLSEAACQAHGWYSRNTAANPLALQGKKTVAFEIWEQLGRRMPDQVFVPVGDGVTLAALAVGFGELVRCGVAQPLPRLIGVQAAGAAPLADAHRSGKPWTISAANTIADGIAVSDPAFGTQALEAVRETGGTFVVVTDEEIRSAIGRLAGAGLLVEPAGAAGFAGLLRAGSAAIGDGSTTVVLATGAGVKDPRWWPDDAGETRYASSLFDEFSVDGLPTAVSR